MTPKEKAIELLSKINNGEITDEIWENASAYAKSDLKRKALIVVSEVIATDMLIDEEIFVNTVSYVGFWEQVNREIISL